MGGGSPALDAEVQDWSHATAQPTHLPECHLLCCPCRPLLALAATGMAAVENRVNGLITNDKFCWTRRGALSLSWPRSRPLPRAWRQETPGSGYVPPDDRVSRHHRGGRSASSPSTLMAPAPSTGSSPRPTAALGSGVPARTAVGSALSADPASARPGGPP